MKLNVVETDRWGVFWLDPGEAWLDDETVGRSRLDAIKKFNKIYSDYASERKKANCKALKICGKL